LRKKDEVCTAITEAIEKSQFSGLNLCPIVVSLEIAGITSCIPRVCKMTAKLIQIKPNSVFCSLSGVKVMESWKPEVSDPKPETNTYKSFQNVQDLGIKVNKENLTDEQFIGKWEHIFSKSSTDIGNFFIKHHISLTDNKPFKLLYRRIPPAM
jgi:hypothetical protein